MTDRKRYDRYAKTRDKRGLTDYQVSQITGVAPSVLSDWKNDRSEPKAEKMVRIAQALNVSAEFLIVGDKPRK